MVPFEKPPLHLQKMCSQHGNNKKCQNLHAKNIQKHICLPFVVTCHFAFLGETCMFIFGFFLFYFILFHAFFFSWNLFSILIASMHLHSQSIWLDKFIKKPKQFICQFDQPLILNKSTSTCLIWLSLFC